MLKVLESICIKVLKSDCWRCWWFMEPDWLIGLEIWLFGLEIWLFVGGVGIKILDTVCALVLV